MERSDNDQLETRYYNDDAIEEEEEEDDDDDDELQRIIDESMEEHVAELDSILGRGWSSDDYPAMVAESAYQVATATMTVEEAACLAVDYLDAPGDLFDQLAPIIAEYFCMLMEEWLRVEDEGPSEDGEGVRGEDGDGDGDEILSQFRMRHYNNDDDGEEEETDDCCICLERLHCGVVATLHCRHEFHGECIGRWLRRGRNFCPLCKARAFN